MPWPWLSFAEIADGSELLVDSANLDHDEHSMNDGLLPSCDPRVWGPPVWNALHKLIAGYPTEVPPDMQTHTATLMESLSHTLPCKSCREHLQQHFLSDPIEPHLATRDDLQRWLVHLHNSVNEDLGKPILSEEEALQQVAQSSACWLVPLALNLARLSLRGQRIKCFSAFLPTLHIDSIL
mmetsp:Transcript_95193/g.188589  ORF Transcript_95193/g.188589 Transcript_95193/m.188589 type:complete len:181 (-) Transcript_95193:170-712(-)